MAVTIQLRRDTAAAWTSANPTLAQGEMGVETDTSKYKIGDGVTAWASLAYSSFPSTGISASTVTTKGDLLAATASSTISRFGVGTNNQVLLANSATATGLEWSGSLSSLTSVSTIKLTATTVIEPSLVSATAATGTIQINFASNPTVYYTTAASGSFSFNVRGSSGVTLDSLLAVGDIATVTFMVTNTGTAYYPSAFTVDTSYTPTIKWQGGTAPTGGNANSIDLYTYSLIKTAANTYTAFASQTKFA